MTSAFLSFVNGDEHRLIYFRKGIQFPEELLLRR